MPNRVKRKRDARLTARVAEHKDIHPINGMKCKRPGSQNRKK